MLTVFYADLTLLTVFFNGKKLGFLVVVFEVILAVNATVLLMARFGDDSWVDESGG